MNTAAINTPTAIATGMLRFARLRRRARAADRTARRLAAAAAAGLHRWSAGHARRIGADRDPRRFAGDDAGLECSVGDHLVLSGTPRAGHGVGAGFGRRIVLPHRRLGRERRPHVELVVVAGPGTVTSDVGLGGRGAAPRRSAVRSSEGATRCRWRRTSDRHRQLPGREWARARRTVDVVLLVVTIPSPGVVRHRLSFPSPLLGHARTPSVPAVRHSDLEQLVLLAAQRARRCDRRARG